MKIDYDNCKDFINAKEIELGINVEIGEGTFISGIGGPVDKVIIGDNVFIDKNCVILVPEFVIGDYGKIFKYGRISGYKPCRIGHNFYVDASVILNSTDNLTIGNNVGIGSFSALWTHMKFGDIVEGCRFNYTKEMIIEDDVWFNAACIVAPIIAKKKSMALAGAMVTRDMEENHIYAGSPAVDITPKIGTQFIERTIEEKISMMEKNLDEFSKMEPGARDYIKIVADSKHENDEAVSYFNVSDRTYSKRRSTVEIKFMKFLLPTAKFVPDGNEKKIFRN